VSIPSEADCLYLEKPPAPLESKGYTPAPPHDLPAGLHIPSPSEER
jgi:hypothetical protein